MDGQLHAPAALHTEEEPAVPSEKGADCTPEPVWTFWSRDKSFAPARVRTPYHPAHSLASTLTAPSQLSRDGHRALCKQASTKPSGLTGRNVENVIFRRDAEVTI